MDAVLAGRAVAELRFDPDNPRIPTDVDPTDEQAVLDWMLQDAGLVELMGSIAVNGFFPAEPLLITPAESGSGYWVLEGNRRLAAVKLLLEPERAPRRKVAVAAAAAEVVDQDALSRLPCVEFGHRRDVLDYLGYRHITGIKEWEPAAKARYLRELYNEHLGHSGDDVYRKIARIIGSRSDYVMRLLGSLDLLEEIASDQELEDLGVSYEDISFSLLTLALNYTSISRYLNLQDLTRDSFRSVDHAALRNLAKWMYVKDPERERTQLGESRNMKLLATALQKPSGVESLRRGEVVEDAVRASLDVGEVVLRSIKEATSRLIGAQSMLHRVDNAETIAQAIEGLGNLQDLCDTMDGALKRTQRRRAAADV